MASGMARGKPTLTGAARMADRPAVLGALVAVLAAIARRLGAELANWPTPRGSDAHKGVRTRNGAEAEAQRRRSGHDLPTTAALAGWPTPDGALVNDRESVESWEARREKLRAKGYNGNGADRPLSVAARLAGWPTPKAERADQDTTFQGGNPTLGKVAGWATPKARDYRSEQGPHHLDRMAASRGSDLSRQAARMDGSGALAPEFSRWLMGYPEAWLVSVPSAADWRRWQGLMAPVSEGRRRTALGLSGD